ncbi:hypothetical protein JW711_05495 [Candidatus Woesearchaeota archaeon]|nr:hypothetical protein [Candidatus Woesearchaeota archaeon]
MKSPKPAKNVLKSRPKINPLKPSMREDKRYVAFEIISERPLDRDADSRLIASIKSLLGVFQASSAGVLKVSYDQASQRGVFRVNRKAVDLIRSCFVMLRRLGDTKVLVRTLKVSGMVHKVNVH